MNPVREAARALRLRIEAGETLTLDEARSACVTREDAVTAFSGPVTEDGNTLRVECCGSHVTISSGLFGTTAWCETCGARIADATGPTSSPFLRQTRGSLEIPSKEWVESFGDRDWIVMHEGDRT